MFFLKAILNLYNLKNQSDEIIEKRIKMIFTEFDIDRDQVISKKEFVKGCLNVNPFSRHFKTSLEKISIVFLFLRMNSCSIFSIQRSISIKPKSRQVASFTQSSLRKNSYFLNLLVKNYLFRKEGKSNQ